MLVRTRCPLGGPEEADIEVYPANFDVEQLNAAVFSARRMPDTLHYRMVRNTVTGTFRSDPILDDATLERLYRESSVTYRQTERHITATYLEYAEAVWPLLPDRRGVLEIGCGDGFFLKEALQKGFRRVCGVEPSADAIANADPLIRGHIHEGAIESGAFEPESFSLICGFQVLDHLAHPNDVLGRCMRLLVPGGAMYWICHDIGARIPRLLGRRCPMIDIEHVVLYDRHTIAALFERNGFLVDRVFRVANRYPVAYWAYLAPMPRLLKGGFLAVLNASGLGRIKVRLSLGNLGIIARKPLDRQDKPGNDDAP